MSTVDRPVTEMAETAVNSASASGVHSPSPRRASGIDSSAVVIRMSAVKATIANRAGEDVVMFASALRSRRSGPTPSSRRAPDRVAVDIPHLPSARGPVSWYSRPGLTSLDPWPTSSM